MAAVPAEPADSVVALGLCGGNAPRDGTDPDAVTGAWLLWWPEAVMLTGSIMLSSYVGMGLVFLREPWPPPSLDISPSRDLRRSPELALPMALEWRSHAQLQLTREQ